MAASTCAVHDFCDVASHCSPCTGVLRLAHEDAPRNRPQKPCPRTGCCCGYRPGFFPGGPLQGGGCVPGGIAPPRLRRSRNGSVFCSGSGRKSDSYASIPGRRDNAFARAIPFVASFRPGSGGKSTDGSLVNIRQLEHVIRARGSITGCREIVVIGSQSLLASFPDAPEDLVGSMDVDCYPLENPAPADLIDGSIVELSPFHETFGCYAHVIGPETASLPAGRPPREREHGRNGRSLFVPGRRRASK